MNRQILNQSLTLRLKIISCLPYFLLRLVGLIAERDRAGLPSKLGKYELHKDLSEPNGRFAVGIYVCGAEKVVAKIWGRNLEDPEYFALLQEINVLRTFNSSAFPKLVDYSISGQRLVLVTAYIQSQSKKVNQGVKDYQKMVSLFNSLGQRCTKEERKLIGERRLTDFVALYPLLLMVALVKYPRLFRPLIRGAEALFQSLSQSRNQTRLSLIHGDYHAYNTLHTRGGKSFLLDLEQVVFTYPEYEAISALLSLSISKELRKYLENELLARAAKSSSEASRCRFLLINRITHYLTGAQSEEKLAHFGYYLEFARRLR